MLGKEVMGSQGKQEGKRTPVLCHISYLFLVLSWLSTQMLLGSVSQSEILVFFSYYRKLLYHLFVEDKDLHGVQTRIQSSELCDILG